VIQKDVLFLRFCYHNSYGGIYYYQDAWISWEMAEEIVKAGAPFLNV